MHQLGSVSLGSGAGAPLRINARPTSPRHRLAAKRLLRAQDPCALHQRRRQGSAANSYFEQPGSGGAERNVNSSWNPLGLDTKNDGGAPEQAEEAASARLLAVSGGLAFVSALVMASDPAIAASGQKIDAFFDFNPVCPAADGAFRVGQRTAAFIAGDQNIENYRPLINDVLIRVRTEICVLESFLRETATPFIREKGIGWVLPLRETSETYLAGVVFMVGANFILLGSTKVVAIISIYADLLLGLPARLLGQVLSAAEDRGERRYGQKMDQLMERQMKDQKEVMEKTAQASEREAKLLEVNIRYSKKMEELKEELDASIAKRKDSAIGKASTVAAAASIPLRLYGKASLAIRQVLEVFDTFCSRYFVTFTVAYIIVKTVHYVLLPDFP